MKPTQSRFFWHTEVLSDGFPTLLFPDFRPDNLLNESPVPRPIPMNFVFCQLIIDIKYFRIEYFVSEPKTALPVLDRQIKAAARKV